GEAAAQPLWERYFDRLVHQARKRLRARARRRGLEDEEDAAPSDFDSFCCGAARGRFPPLGDPADPRRLLVVLTERKALDQARRERRQKRGGGKVRGRPGPVDADPPGGAPVSVAGSEPTPVFAAVVADECRGLLGRVRDEPRRAVARLRM